MSNTTPNDRPTDATDYEHSPSTTWRATYAALTVPVPSDRLERCFAYDCSRPLAEAGAALCTTHRKRYLEVSI